MAKFFMFFAAREMVSVGSAASWCQFTRPSGAPSWHEHRHPMTWGHRMTVFPHLSIFVAVWYFLSVVFHPTQAMPLKILLALFIAFITWRTWVRRRLGEMTAREAALWTLLWLGVLAASLNPHATDVLARWFGVGRGADLLIFISVVALFSLVWWLLSRVQKVERDITAVVRNMALREAEGVRSRGQGAGDSGTKIPNT